MNIFNQPDSRMSGPGSLRSAAENYAASLGMAPGSPGWGAAVRDFVMNQAPASPAGAPVPMQGGMPGPGAPLPNGGPPAGQAFAAAAPLAMPVQPASAQPGPGPVPDPAIAQLQDLAAARGPAGPRDSLFRVPASSGPSSGSIGNGPAPDREEDEIQMAQLQEGGQSFRRGPPGGSRPAQRPAPPQQPPQQRSRYPSGRLSAGEEAPGGSRTVSSGRGDRGGVSYGNYQLSTNTGTAGTFVASPEARRWQAELRGARPGTPEFRQRWQAIADRDGEAFEQAQHDFIGRTHYRPAIDAVRERTQVDLDAMAPAVREAAWSVSVQHGRASLILGNAATAADRRMRDANGQVDRTSPAYQRAMIEEIYDARIAYVRDRVLPNARPQDRQGLRNAIANRYPRERARALQMLDADDRED